MCSDSCPASIIIKGPPIVRSRTSRGGGVGGGVGSGWGSENLWLTFVLGTLGAGKHDVDDIYNVQCLITMSIGEKLSPGEETRAAESISVHSYTEARHSTAQRSMRDLPKKFSVRGRLQFRIPT